MTTQELIKRLRAHAEEHEYIAHVDDDQKQWMRDLYDASDMIERLSKGNERYETARRMNPMQWSAAWELNITTGKPFDEIIDNMRPFVFG